MSSSKSRLPALLAATAVVLLIAAGIALWNSYSRVEELEQQLAGTQQRAATAEQQAADISRELSSAEERVGTARQRVRDAEQQLRDLTAKNNQSELVAEALREQSDTVRAERQAAQAALEDAQQELEDIRLRRQAELDRMQRAMNQVAPTERTSTGMVMQLSDDAFRFEFDSAELRPLNRETLSRVAGILLTSEGYHVFIDGYTDDQGPDAYNQGLSERRATSVQDYLVEAGIPAVIITVNGFGNSNPVENEKTRQARARNRRVEIGIVDTIIKYQAIATDP